MNLYGHACGATGFEDRCSAVYNGEHIEDLPPAGFCKYGSRKHGYLLDHVLDLKKNHGYDEHHHIDERFTEFEHFVSYCWLTI